MTLWNVCSPPSFEERERETSRGKLPSIPAYFSSGGNFQRGEYKSVTYIGTFSQPTSLKLSIVLLSGIGLHSYILSVGMSAFL